jgi:hypothetical protein
MIWKSMVRLWTSSRLIDKAAAAGLALLIALALASGLWLVYLLGRG